MTQEQLIKIYADWNRQQGLNLGSADEHLFDPTLTVEQMDWLIAFIWEWEATQFSDCDNICCVITGQCCKCCLKGAN